MYQERCSCSGDRVGPLIAALVTRRRDFLCLAVFVQSGHVRRRSRELAITDVDFVDLIKFITILVFSWFVLFKLNIRAATNHDSMN